MRENVMRVLTHSPVHGLLHSGPNQLNEVINLGLNTHTHQTY